MRFPSSSSTTRISSLAIQGFSGCGSENVNFAPRPGALSTRIAPPCNSTSFFASARPRPVPSDRWAPLICVNSSKIAAWSSGAIPMPESLTETSIALGQARAGDRDRAAFGRELDGVRQQVQQDLPELALVGDRDSRAADRVSRRRRSTCRPRDRVSAPAHRRRRRER